MRHCKKNVLKQGLRNGRAEMGVAKGEVKKKMNLTCMSRSYEDKSIGISYSVIFVFVYENER